MNKILEQMEKDLAEAGATYNRLQQVVQEERRRYEKERLVKEGYYTPLKHGIVKENMWNRCVERDEIENGLWVSEDIISTKPTWPKGMEVVLIRVRFTDEEIWVPKSIPDYEYYEKFVDSYTSYIQEI